MRGGKAEEAKLLCRSATTVSGGRVKSAHSWQDTELPNTDPQECEGSRGDDGRTRSHTLHSRDSEG